MRSRRSLLHVVWAEKAYMRAIAGDTSDDETNAPQRTRALGEGERKGTGEGEGEGKRQTYRGGYTTSYQTGGC